MLRIKNFGRCGALLWVLAACSGQSAEVEKLQVVTSIRPLALMVEQVAGEAADVQTLLPANADPHNMALRISERSRLEQADLVVWLGPDFERFLQKPMADKAPAAKLALADSAGLNWPSQGAHHHDEHEHHHHEGRDMHLWLDPANAKAAMAAIHEQLVSLRPQLREELDQRLQQAQADVERASQDIKQLLEPVAARGFGVGHNAYGHFVNAFDLNQLAAINEVPGQRMSAKQRHELQQQLDGAACLLVERASQPNERLAAAIGIPLVVADPLAGNPELTSYSEFLRDLSDKFYRCLAGGDGEGEG